MTSDTGILPRYSVRGYGHIARKLEGRVEFGDRLRLTHHVDCEISVSIRSTEDRVRIVPLSGVQSLPHEYVFQFQNVELYKRFGRLHKHELGELIRDLELQFREAGSPPLIERNLPWSNKQRRKLFQIARAEMVTGKMVSITFQVEPI